MKKVNFLLATCAMLLVFGACSNSQGQKATKEDTTETTVTTTHDLVYWDLQGPVKRCDGVEFDRKGVMVGKEGYDPFALEEPYRDFDTVTFDYLDYCKWSRNDQGQISSIICFEGREEFTWSDGRVAESISYFESQKTLTVNEYDADGRLVKQMLYNGMEDEEVTEDDEWLFSTMEYTYLEFDDHGNWTRRTAKYIDAAVDFTDETEETRTIEYYE